MVIVVDNYVERTSAKLLRLLRHRGGYLPLSSIQFSQSVIQYLLDRKLVKFWNTGSGFVLEIMEDSEHRIHKPELPKRFIPSSSTKCYLLQLTHRN